MYNMLLTSNTTAQHELSMISVFFSSP